MNTKHKHTDAYKLASSFYLASTHGDWSGERIRKAILADPDGDDTEALVDQQELEVWDPIERHIENRHVMEDPHEVLDGLIENLANALLQFARGGNVSHAPTNAQHLTNNQMNTTNYKEEKTMAFNDAIQQIQNNLRDWRDNDPEDNDIHWYVLIDAIEDATGISPQ